jgi:hypothetical protein
MSKKMHNYNNIIERLSKQVLSRFNEIEAIYNFELGDETEIALCNILENILPDKYGICRGFIISYDNKKAGDDIIIYDKMNYPLIRSNPSDKYSLKCQVPIEAVYAYIECKNSITDLDVLTKSIEQVESVKKLLFEREKIGNEKYEKNGQTFCGKVRSWPRVNPEYKNQPYAIIFTRNWDNSLQFPAINSKYAPDFFVLGENHIASQIEKNYGPDGTKGTLFFDYNNDAIHIVEETNNTSFGAAILMLLQALQEIKLLPINWYRLIDSNAVNYK